MQSIFNCVSFVRLYSVFKGLKVLAHTEATGKRKIIIMNRKKKIYKVHVSLCGCQPFTVDYVIFSYVWYFVFMAIRHWSLLQLKGPAHETSP